LIKRLNIGNEMIFKSLDESEKAGEKLKSAKVFIKG